MIKELETLPENKMPPVAIYKKLVELTGLRNSWTVKEWINFLNKKGEKKMTKKRQNKTIIKILEDNGFRVNKENNQYLISQYTPAGEDWGFYLEDLHDLPKYAENFDVDENFEMWVEAKQNGVEGVPSYSVLLKDQQWKQQTLRKVAESI